MVFMKRLFIAAALVLVAAARAHALPFIEDDYAKATALAKTKNLPIFVETWAPW